VFIERAADQADLLFLAQHDDDAFARYEAMQDLVVGHLIAAVEDRLGDDARKSGRAAIAAAMRAVLADDQAGRPDARRIDDPAR
jgi:aminopeptidase N